MTIYTNQVTLWTETKNDQDYQILEIVLKDQSITPDCLKELKEHNLLSILNTKKGVIINGKAPIWLMAYLIHECHATSWVATNDPRLGAIIVESHSPSRKVGDVFKWQ
jgi:CRISPR-associated protein Csx3